jgi:hypothetical protein
MVRYRFSETVMSETLSLYLDLEAGRTADLEVVARAAIAFSEAVRELAYVLDPTLELRVELASGTPGSLSLDTVLRAVKGADPQKVKAVVWAVMAYFAVKTSDYAIEKVLDAGYDAATAKPPVAEQVLSQEEMEKLSEMVARKVAAPHVARVYEELEKDTAVKGVGASQKPGTRPASIVPRSEFQARAHPAPATKTIVVQASERTSTWHKDVVLISPVLIDSKRKWKLKDGDREFGAAVKDQEFLKNMLSGSLPVPLAAGIHMDVTLEVLEKKENGVWVPKSFSVTKVNDLKPPPTQVSLPFGGPEQH